MATYDERMMVLRGLCDGFNAHNVDQIMSYFAEDCWLQMPRGSSEVGQRFDGFEAVKNALAGRFEGLPDVHYGEEQHTVDGDIGTSRWLLTGTRPDGEKVKVRGCDFYHFRDDGKVVGKDSYWKIVE